MIIEHKSEIHDERTRNVDLREYIPRMGWVKILRHYKRSRPKLANCSLALNFIWCINARTNLLSRQWCRLQYCSPDHTDRYFVYKLPTLLFANITFYQRAFVSHMVLKRCYIFRRMLLITGLQKYAFGFFISCTRKRHFSSVLIKAWKVFIVVISFTSVNTFGLYIATHKALATG